jgi:hypothetical protein
VNQDLATRDELLTLIDFLLDEFAKASDGVDFDDSILTLAEHILEQG